MPETASVIDRDRIEKRLDRVTDPELDRSIIDLDYIKGIGIKGRRVTVRFKLPTAWCSPAFAWMMATDIREEVTALPGVEETVVRLVDHMHADGINRGINEGLTFEAVFDDADGDVEAVRETLDHKARMARQHRAATALLDAGIETEQLATLTRGDLDLDEARNAATVSLGEGAVIVPVPLEPIRRYLTKATDVGIATSPGDRLFATSEGDPIPPKDFETVHARARLAATNMSGQSGVCGELQAERLSESE